MRLVDKKILDYIDETTDELHDVFHFDCLDCYPLLKKYSTNYKYHLIKKMNLQEDIKLAEEKCFLETTFLESQSNKYTRKSLLKKIVPENSDKSVGNLIKRNVLKTEDDYQYYEKVIHNTFNLKITREAIKEQDINDSMISDEEVHFDFINDNGEVYTMSSYQICNIISYSGEKLLVNEIPQKTSNEFKRFHYKLNIEGNVYFLQQSIKKYNKYFLNNLDWMWLQTIGDVQDHLDGILPEDYYVLFNKYFKNRKISWSVIPYDFPYIQENFGQNILLKENKI